MRPAVFDLDGTILDTEKYILNAFNHALGKHGLPPITSASKGRIAGLPLHSTYKLLAPGFDHEALAKLHVEFQQDNKHLVKPYEGITEMLEELKANRVPMAIATGRFRITTLPLLEKFNLTHYFKAIACGDDGFPDKPNPAIFTWCAKQLNALPRDCFVIGDSPLDIEAGNAMHATTILAGYGYAAREEMQAKPSFNAKTPPDITNAILAKT